MALRVIDARSGKDVYLGQRVTYPDGESWRLLSVKDRFFRATARVEVWRPGTPPTQHEQPLSVRFTHPHFFLQRVGFFPS